MCLIGLYRRSRFDGFDITAEKQHEHLSGCLPRQTTTEIIQFEFDTDMVSPWMVENSNGKFADIERGSLAFGTIGNRISKQTNEYLLWMQLILALDRVH